ncbi:MULTISPECIES: NAD-dependent epimerase/dehydratase family protein [unclassified Coleofasciculus]|uniref:NAD-dependent epimerase/dehydratase family protein n=1 Tax=unclassified Coleofasciculus TaxID=2692782 RepID=UPI00187F1612|nr:MULTISPECIES: NAD(P)-dependent oxidoreductase [unclassified Coleofasciculus]MBE9126148.1 NAD(P)-dependent oxidoreductase [Coleofasciculus sp. LEGE 07081]MBE9149566.1 NAD(P)-dependent oxidoreductase [Coleofasciculus sp. LEGE 07092]
MEDPQYKLPLGSRALVTGATGFTGSVLAQKLVEQGVKVVAIARQTSNLKPFKDMNIEWIRGDVFDESLISKAVKGVNYIFHMVTPFREAKSPDMGYYNVHVLSTQLLAKAALKEPDFKRFVHVSTIGVHGHIAHPPADENAPIYPGDVYQETKLEGELWLKNYADQEGLPITIVRPAGIYGPREKRLLKIYKWVSRQWVPVIGDGNNLLHFIHVDDLTNFFILAATHPHAVGEVFICGSPEAMPFKKMVSIISDYYGTPVRFIKFPAVPLFALGDFFEVICRPLGIEPPIYRRRLAFYTKDRSFNTSKMNHLLGFVPAHSDEEGLKELAQWYLDQGWISLTKSLARY